MASPVRYKNTRAAITTESKLKSVQLHCDCTLTVATLAACKAILETVSVLANQLQLSDEVIVRVTRLITPQLRSIHIQVNTNAKLRVEQMGSHHNVNFN